MKLNWHTEETVRWCWNTPSYKSGLCDLIENRDDFTQEVYECIESFNRDVSDDLMVDASKVDVRFVYAKFCELLDIPCSLYDLPLAKIDYLDDYDDFEELKMKNIQYSRNEDCTDCRECFELGQDVCIWDNSQIESITINVFKDGEWIQHTINDEEEIRKFCENERKREKEIIDEQWRRKLFYEMFKNK